jgi:hypothetical protein
VWLWSRKMNKRSVRVGGLPVVVSLTVAIGIDVIIDT